MLSTLEINERRSSDAVTSLCKAELDDESGAELAVKLADEGRLGAASSRISTELEFMDSAGMGVLHRASIWAGEDGWTLDLTGPRPDVARVLRLTNLA